MEQALDQQRRQWIALVPNLLSGVRLVLAAVLPFTAPGWWLWIIVVGGLTDFLDGQIARRFRVTSAAGGLLDGIADKLFVLSAIVTLTVDGRLAVWETLLVLTRDIVVAIIALYVAVRREWAAFGRMTAGRLGKWSTVGQFSLFVMLLVQPDWARPFLYATVCLSVGAALTYGMRFSGELQEDLMR